MRDYFIGFALYPEEEAKKNGNIKVPNSVFLGVWSIYCLSDFNVSFKEFLGKSLSEKCIVNSSLAAIANLTS